MVIKGVGLKYAPVYLINKMYSETVTDSKSGVYCSVTKNSVDYVCKHERGSLCSDSRVRACIY